MASYGSVFPSWTLGVPKRSSPILVGDELYTISDKGVTTCCDVRTGKSHWSERVLADCSACPVFADDRLYFFGEDGTTTVIEAGPEFKVVAENALEGKFCASPALSQGHLFLRSDTVVYCIGPAAQR